MNRVLNMFGKFVRDERGQLMWIGLAVILIIAVGFFLFTWMILSNLETIGRGLLYISGAFLVIVGVSVIAKKYLFESKGVI